MAPSLCLLLLLGFFGGAHAQKDGNALANLDSLT
jgi:hypothetical protein